MSRALTRALPGCAAAMFAAPLRTASAFFSQSTVAADVSTCTPPRTLRITTTTTGRGFSSTLLTQRVSLFTNGKKSFAPGSEEELKAREEAAQKASAEFLRRPVDADGHNTLRARDVENLLSTKKQLNEELPTVAELEKALKEGNMDRFTTKPDKDEE